MVEWEWYTEPDTLRIFLHLLLLANHSKTEWRGQVVDEGEILIGRKILAQQLKIGEQRVRTSLARLKSTSNLTIKTFSKFSLIKINNWKLYQQSTSNLTNNQPATNQQLTTSKNVKNVKNVKNRERGDFVPPTLQEVSGYCQERGNGVDPSRFLDFYSSKGWMVGKNKMKDWKAAVRTWEGRDGAKKETGFLDLNLIK